MHQKHFPGSYQCSFCQNPIRKELRVMETACGVPRGQEHSLPRRAMPGGPAVLQPQLATALVGTQNPSLSISSRAEGSLGNPGSIACSELGIFFRHSRMLGPTRSSGLLIRLSVANLPGLCFLKGKRVDYFKLMFRVISRAPSHRQ